MKEKENIEDYKPFALVFGENAFDSYGNRNIFYYERNWFCEENSIIHHNEKSVLNCPYCSKKYFKPNYENRNRKKR